MCPAVLGAQDSSSPLYFRQGLGPPGPRRCPRPSVEELPCYSSFFLRSPFRELRALSGPPGEQLGSVWREHRQGSRTGSTAYTESSTRQDTPWPPGRWKLGSGQSHPREVIHRQKRVILGQGLISCTRMDRQQARASQADRRQAIS